MERVYLFSRHAGDPVKVGVWQIDDDRVGRFQYHDDWLGRGDAFPLDPVHLPLSSDIYETPRKGGIFAVFEDAGPDQWGERVLAHEHPARDLSLIEKLLYANGRGVGCLLFSASRERPKPFPAPVDWHSLTQAQEGIDRLIAGEAVSDELMHLLEPGSSLGGARPKISVTKDGRLWLAKFSRQDDTYDVPRTEFATMQLARRAGISTPDVELAALPDGRAVFLVERFDQYDGTASHYVSANTLLGIDRVREDDMTANYSYAGIAWRLRQHAPANVVGAVQTELYRRMVFNVLARNTDDHVRNHGVLVDRYGIHLSPAFDIVPQLRPGHEHALGVGPDGRYGSVENCLGDAARFALTDAQAVEIVNEVGVVLRDRMAQYRRAGLGSIDLRRVDACFDLVPQAPLPIR